MRLKKAKNGNSGHLDVETLEGTLRSHGRKWEAAAGKQGAGNLG